MKKLLIVCIVFLSIASIITANAEGEIGSGAYETYPYTIVSKVMEANTRVAAIIIDFGKEIPINWTLEDTFEVTAELLPLESYTGQLIANSGAQKAPRTITKAYTSAVPEIGSPSQGQYVIIEMDPYDDNASSWYIGFNPGIRQLLPYEDNMIYEIDMLYNLNYYTRDPERSTPASSVDVISKYSQFELKGYEIETADEFEQGLYEMPENTITTFLPYNLYKPEVEAGEKVPLVVALHGSGQSHDYNNFADDPSADTLSPLLTNQIGTTWVENANEKCFVLVPQMPARDTPDETGERGWRQSDTKKLLLALIDELIAENPSIDVDRLYLTGLSMGGMGSWKIVTDEDPAVSDKFAAAVIIAGADGFPSRTDTPAQVYDKMLDSFNYESVQIPLWICCADTDPVVPAISSRVPFAILSGSMISDEGAVIPSTGVSVDETDLYITYMGRNITNGADTRFSEYKFGNGDTLLDLGMVTRNGHFSWEVTYKDQDVIDWVFSQSK